MGNTRRLNKDDGERRQRRGSSPLGFGRKRRRAVVVFGFIFISKTVRDAHVTSHRIRYCTRRRRRGGGGRGSTWLGGGAGTRDGGARRPMAGRAADRRPIAARTGRRASTPGRGYRVRARRVCGWTTREDYGRSLKRADGPVHVRRLVSLSRARIYDIIIITSCVTYLYIIRPQCVRACRRRLGAL